jgi:aryl-alcohol dehydrogenase
VFSQVSTTTNELFFQFLPQLVMLHKAGKFPINRLVTVYPVTELDRAIQDIDKGNVGSLIIDQS